MVKEEFSEARGTYGSPRVFKKVKERGISCSENTVAKIMREEGLAAAKSRCFVPKTTNSNHKDPIAPRVFEAENGPPEGPNEVWAGDITYVSIGNKWKYLSVVLDLYNREVVGWSLDDTLEVQGVCTALKNAITSRRADAKIIFHSDRGSQYASKQFKKLLAGEEILPSMSRKGNCYDNAYVESFFKTYKCDLKAMGISLNKANVRSETFQYIETCYNRKRIHSSLNYLSPMAYLAAYKQKSDPPSGLKTA